MNEFPLQDSCTRHAGDFVYVPCPTGFLDMTSTEILGGIGQGISCTDIRMDYFFYCGPPGTTLQEVVYTDQMPRFSPQPNDYGNAVPIPSTLLLMLLGVAALKWRLG